MIKALFLLLTIMACTGYGQAFKELKIAAMQAEQEQRFPQAIALYEKVLRLEPFNHFICIELSVIYRQLNNPDSAIIYCNKGLAIAPGDTAALFQRGVCYFDKEEYQRALEDLTLSFENTHYNNPDASHYIGKCYFGLKQIEKAIEFFKITLVLEPNDKYSFCELGRCYASDLLASKDTALFYYNKAIEQDSQYYLGYFNRARLYENQFYGYEKST